MGRQEGRVHFDRAGVLPSVDGKVKKEQGRVIMVSSGDGVTDDLKIFYFKKAQR